MPKRYLRLRLRLLLEQGRPALLTSLSVAGGIIVLRLLGLLQSSELAAFDQLFRLRPPASVDQRLVIVQVEEADLQQINQWPIPDAVMATLLEKLAAYQPRVIGLDIYRDLPVNPGHDRFVKVCKTLPILIGIEKLADEQSPGVLPPPCLDSNQVSFNNVVVDRDGIVRRSVLYWHIDETLHKSFALQLALKYLKAEGISPKPAKINPDYLQLGQAIFPPLQPNDGAYVQVDNSGYQIVANFRTGANFRTVSLADVLADRVPAHWMRDRIVLIGSTAPSLQDFFYTSYSSSLLGDAQPVPGVELHAQFVSQILSSALEGRPVIHAWSEPGEWLWILGWSVLGASAIWHWRSPRRAFPYLLLASMTLGGGVYIAFLAGWWLPLVPPLLALGSSAIVVTSYIAHQEEELKRSKEFLQSVINTIPDPVFVKDKNHRWIILNPAYCQFIGYPLESLLTKSDYDLFPRQEAEVFYSQNELVFQTGIDQEHEEEFTDAFQTTHFISTKRSLHKDVRGNLFLVGVIRDITERKRMEEELKRTAAELTRSNAELKQSENRLRYLAHHDPLTGLSNRQHFQDSLRQCLELASSHEQIFALLFLDLDGFKQVNDSLGHDYGDLILKGVAQRLTGCLRSNDIVSRLGGDEFTVILPNLARVEDAARVAQKVLTALSKGFLLQGHTTFVTVSIGISVYPRNGKDVETLIKKADTAMYHAKNLGRNQYTFAQELIF